MNSLLRLWRGLPGAMRLGFAVLALGLGADLAYHLAFGIEPSHHDHASEAVPLAIHMIVVVGMALTIVGVIGTAFDHRRRSPRPEGGR
ncbi:MAG TPA: hypothetical protein VEC15_03775 [Actinomycetota bacterium]|nr:hypothetical protein [Actinomycetota bacterium]